jgi:hypothetical protein
MLLLHRQAGGCTVVMQTNKACTGEYRNKDDSGDGIEGICALTAALTR